MLVANTIEHRVSLLSPLSLILAFEALFLIFTLSESETPFFFFVEAKRKSDCGCTVPLFFTTPIGRIRAWVLTVYNAMLFSFLFFTHHLLVYLFSSLLPSILIQYILYFSSTCFSIRYDRNTYLFLFSVFSLSLQIRHEEAYTKTISCLLARSLPDVDPLDFASRPPTCPFIVFRGQP